MTSTYITPIEYARANTGQETASLVGNVLRLSAGVVIGATSLPVTPNTTVALAANDRVVIFDGSSSEEVMVTAPASVGANAITTTPIQFAHAQFTALCSDGVRGSLADDIITASDMVEDQCIQSLLLTTRIDTLSLQTMQASISNDGVLTLKPQNFPVQTVTGVVLNSGLTSISFDATKASIELGQQLVKFYQLLPTTNPPPQGSPFGAQVSQRTKGTITLTYTSGFAYAAMPPRVKKACVLYVSDLLSKRRNPSGASHVQQGKVTAKYGHVGDISGESDLIKEARNLLSSFSREAF
jgi:hypothetical protein